MTRSELCLICSGLGPEHNLGTDSGIDVGVVHEDSLADLTGGRNTLSCWTLLAVYLGRLAISCFFPGLGPWFSGKPGKQASSTGH